VFAFQSKKKNFGKWYRQTLFDAGIIDQRYPVQGFVVWKEYGTKIIEKAMKILERFLEDTGHSKTYFPMLIPEELFGKESQHLRGFENEVFWVTKAGKQSLPRKLFLRPTSETGIYEMFSLWVRSHKDLPIKIYQTVSVFRYETKTTKPLIREREMWPFNEAHTVHATLEEAEKQISIGVEIYKKLFRKLALPYLLVKKPQWELFPGAIGAFEFYTLMPDGRVLETGSVNNLGQAFSRVFNIKYEKADGSHEYTYQTCYGQSERLLASVVSVHGDDYGLVLPPSISPILVVIVPIMYTETVEKVIDYAESIEKTLRKEGFTTVLDLRELTPGEKFYYWERRGIPIRLEIGSREAEDKTVTIVRRDTLTKESVHLEEMTKAIRRKLREIHRHMLKNAKSSLAASVTFASDIANLTTRKRKKKAVIKAYWCENEKCRNEIERLTKMGIIGLAIDKRMDRRKRCIICGGEAREIVYIAKS